MIFHRGNDIPSVSLDGIKVISTDVFDTILLRRAKSQRGRVLIAESRFATQLKQSGRDVPVSSLIMARRAAERFAYQALNIGGDAGEVRLTDLIRRQLQILGIPQHFVEKRVAIELEIEKTALVANGSLAMWLRQQRHLGCRIIATSDTALEDVDVRALIDHYHGPGLIDGVLSSATSQASKRQGGLFAHLLRQEGVRPGEILHIGDDHIADISVPHSLGFKTSLISRPRIVRMAMAANAATAEARRIIGHRQPSQPRAASMVEDVDFGRAVFGPIVAQFCLFIWLYADQAKANSDAKLLFCTRGGTGIRLAFERLSKSLRLPTSTPHDDLCISRLVAARAAVLRTSPAALDELGREFAGSTFADVATALSATHQELPETWHQPFEAGRFFAMLGSPGGRALRDDIALQNDLFREHLDDVSTGAKRIILCDTGLYGSTLRLLLAGFPDLRFEAIQFARSNYKGFSQDHFGKLAGLVVERNRYHPLHKSSVVLRYWQVIEGLFEPSIPSVRAFSRDVSGKVTSNAGTLLPMKPADKHFHPLLVGALQYIDTVRSGEVILGDAERAWSRLRKAIVNPGNNELSFLDVGNRSVDFGRNGDADLFSGSTSASVYTKLTSVRSNLWREGAIARNFPTSKSALLLMMELGHILRGLKAPRH